MCQVKSEIHKLKTSPPITPLNVIFVSPMNSTQFSNHLFVPTYPKIDIFFLLAIINIFNIHYCHLYFILILKMSLYPNIYIRILLQHP